MNEILRGEIVALVERRVDLRRRANEHGDGRFAAALQRQRETLDEQNAERIAAVIKEHGWPGIELVGEDGAEAAWLLVLNADGDHPLQARCLELLRSAVMRGDAPAQYLAYLEDRVLTTIGMPQLYGTQFQSDGHGGIESLPIADRAFLDERRAQMGLPPFSELVETLAEVAE